ncbi:MAG TPA: AMP-binding protein [Actinomycetota bacterium]|jgi:long-chain acyl-CoA synthetase|nr:AMP-binding protein [Actinomycetota bacterium]
MYPGEHARRNPDQAAFIMGGTGEIITFGEYEARANRLAHLFRDLGLRRLDHVAFFMENNVRMLEAEGAAERTGLYFTCINSYLAAEEVAYIVNDSESQVLITSAAKKGVAELLPDLCPKVRRFLMCDGTAPGWESYEEAVAGFPTEPISDERLGAAMLYSSGTTGQPKGILRPLADMHPADALPVMEFVKLMFRFREGQIYLSPAPLYHSAPQASVSANMRLGSTSVIMERFDPEQFLQLVERYGVTHSQMVPTMFSRLLKLPEQTRRAYDISSLECIIHAAAPCPVPVKEAMIEWIGPKIVEYYGATEANGFTFCDSAEWLAHKGTVGKPVLGELLILDDDMNPCPVGTSGTVWFRGATNFEYYNDASKTADSRKEDDAGVMSTVGDVGYVDDDGYLYLTDRKTYMIISGGVNIYPQETENLLITHPKVMDAAVIGVPNEDLGEEVKAVVQLMKDVEPGPGVERELIDFCHEHLARFKCPRSIDFTDELPRLPTGKLYKRLLRDKYWAGHSTSIV